MPKDENGRDLAYVMRQLTDGREPILRVIHDETGDWQFIGITDANSDDGMLIHKVHLIEIDPSVSEVMDLPLEWEAVRSDKGQPWERKKHNPSEK